MMASVDARREPISGLLALLTALEPPETVGQTVRAVDSPLHWAGMLPDRADAETCGQSVSTADSQNGYWDVEDLDMNKKWLMPC